MTPNPNRANRAIGAMFFGGFGGAWISLWAWHVFRPGLAGVAVVATATVCLLAFIYKRSGQDGAAFKQAPDSPAQQRRDRWFHAINIGQWVIILLVGNILANKGLSQWVIPFAIFVVGLHFLPLAILFRNPSHYVTGTALMLLPAVYPFATPSGAGNPIGALGAGVILWASSLWAVLR